MSGVKIAGFPVFWFFFGCSLLGSLGGWFFGFGELGGAITRVAAKNDVRNKVRFVNAEKLVKRRKK